MKLNLTLVDGRNERAVDTVVDGDALAPVADLVPALLRVLGEEIHPGFAARVPIWVDGQRVEGTTPAGEAGVRTGAVLTLFEPADRVVRQAPSGVAELRVVAGPGAGRVHRLPLGTTTVGCGAPDWSLPDLRLPADALSVTADVAGTVTLAVAEGLTAVLETDAVEDAVDWPIGGYVFVGDTVLARTGLGEAPAEVTHNPTEGVVEFNRPPRMAPPTRERQFHMPEDPGELRGRPFPWVMVLAPAVLAVPMALILDNMRYLLFGLMSPLLALANFFSDKIFNSKEHRAKVAEYEARKADLLERVAVARVLERDERRHALPDPATWLAQAIGPGERLWERRPADADHLRLRVGLADLDPETTVEHHQRDRSAAKIEQKPLIGVPTWLGLQQLGVVGVAGEPDLAVPMAQWLMAQVALLHSPRDVRITVLSDAEGDLDWGWVRWLPHLREETDGVSVAVGAKQESVGRRLGELLAVIEAREGAGNRDRRHGADHVVLLDGARRLRTLPAVVELLRRGPKVGVHVICLDEQARQLPAECTAVLELAGGRLTIHENAVEDTADVVPDLVEPAWCETVARCLASLRDTTPADEAAGLPGAARLLEEIQLDPPTPDAIAQRWAAGPSTEVVLGAGYDGPFRLDLRRDGPHALVAGTTGSGKSELLQTWVASLAVANRPDDLTFVLVDYKGGSAFKDCARLPHTVGMVTDLDTHLVGRALVSLGAELHRREHLLAGPGAKDIEDYWALRKRQRDLPPIPRLVLVIDEFASMVAELPDFVTGLVSIAQRGRSLGIHLVLATQRPSGVVTADIKANTNLRISLRVTDRNDSDDVIGAPDAALIGKHQPGRAFVRSGASTLMPFQSGRVGGRSPDRDALPARVEALAWPVSWSELGLPLPQRPKPEGVDTDEEGTDLAALVDAVNELDARLGIAPSHRPWLDALPELVTVADLSEPENTEPDLPAPAPWALVDVPAEQAQRPDLFRLGRSGCLYVVGGPRSGRSTALRTLAGSLADRVGVRDLNIYGLDCGNGALLGLQGLPHTGAVVSRNQTSRAGRLLNRLTDLVDQRQSQMGRAGVADLAELRASLPVDERPPYLLFLLDRWDGFMPTLGEIDGGRLAEQVQALLRDGPAVGLHVVVSGDRTLLSGRLGSLVEEKLLLRMPDRSDYGTVGITPKMVPDSMPDGRAITVDPVLERQVALLSEDVSGAGQNAALREIAERHRDRDAVVPQSLRPFALKEMPDEAPFDDEARALVGAAVDRIRSGWLPLGIGGDRLELVGLDCSSQPACVVSGPGRSGRTGTLLFVREAALLAGLEVRAVCGVSNALSRALGEDAWVLDPAWDEEQIEEWCDQLAAGGVLLIDDADLLRSGAVDEALDEVVGKARSRGWRVVVAGESSSMGSGYSGWLPEARKSRQGLVLSPQTVSDGEVVEQRLARSLLVPRLHPGRGVLLAGGGDPVVLQVPFSG